MKVLHHGTRYLRKILSDNILRCAPYGETHVSLTDAKGVAKYFAELPRDDDEGIGFILTLNRLKMEQAGYNFERFRSANAGFDEREFACLSDIQEVSRFIEQILRVEDAL